MTTMKRQRVLEVLKSRREKAEAAADAVIKEVEALRASARDTKQELKDLERVDEEEAEAATDEVSAAFYHASSSRAPLDRCLTARSPCLGLGCSP